MQLIGMLDSPYARRVAISLQLLGLRFEHQSLSVFRALTQFSRSILSSKRLRSSATIARS